MITATFNNFRLLRIFKRETYKDKSTHWYINYSILFMLFLFNIGYIYGIYLCFNGDGSATYMLVGIIFFFGAVFVYLVVDSQIKMSSSLGDRTMALMKTFVNAIDMKDRYTRGHSRHVHNIIAVFYEHLPKAYKSRIDKEKLLDASMLHDIGKISVPDAVLQKKGSLSEDEWEFIRDHPLRGKKMLNDTSYAELGDWVLYHHERMDGTGYMKLRGEEIPIESRIISIADTYSALCTDRVYRPRQTHRRAIDIMVEVSGTQLDPNLLSIFITIDEQELSEFG